jgi:hypothetical protein
MIRVKLGIHSGFFIMISALPKACFASRITSTHASGFDSGFARSKALGKAQVFARLMLSAKPKACLASQIINRFAAYAGFDSGFARSKALGKAQVFARMMRRAKTWALLRAKPESKPDFRFVEPPLAVSRYRRRR